MLLVTLLYFIPCIVSLLWFLNFAFKVKQPRQKLFMWLLLTQVFYMASYALYIHPLADYSTMLRLDAINVPLSLAWMAMSLVYLYQHTPKGHLHPLQLLMGIPMLIMGSLVNLMYYLLGFDKTERMVEYLDLHGTLGGEFDSEKYRLYLLLDYTLINVLSLVVMLANLSLCYYILRRGGYKPGNVLRFLFRGKETTPSKGIAMLSLCYTLLQIPFVLMGRVTLMQHPVPAIILMLMLSFCVNFICYLEYHSDSHTHFTLYGMSHISSHDEQAGEALADTQEEPQVSHLDMVAEEIDRRIADGLYRDNTLTLSTLAQEMGVCKTVLSTAVNQHFGIPFRDLLNQHRIKAAKLYMEKHPTAAQEETALECGFKDASAFNRKFKEVEGTTPLLWCLKEVRRVKG